MCVIPTGTAISSVWASVTYPCSMITILRTTRTCAAILRCASLVMACTTPCIWCSALKYDMHPVNCVTVQGCHWVSKRQLGTNSDHRQNKTVTQHWDDQVKCIAQCLLRSVHVVVNTLLTRLSNRRSRACSFFLMLTRRMHWWITGSGIVAVRSAGNETCAEPHGPRVWSTALQSTIPGSKSTDSVDE